MTVALNNQADAQKMDTAVASPTKNKNDTQQYADYCKPKLSELLASLGLDVSYTKASGNYLIKEDGQAVLDAVSGFGSAILGHHHPALVNSMMSGLQESIPIVAQGSIPKEAAQLAETLNQFIPGDADYLVNLSNSGTEAVEAALKHAYKVHYDKVEKEYERITRILDDFYFDVEQRSDTLVLPEGKKLIDFRDDLDEYNLEQYEAFKNKPVMISFKGAYHGKTASSLKVTFNKSLREAFEGLSAIQNVFIDPDKPERIPEILKEESCTFYYPVIINHEVQLRPLKITRVMGLIFELIMGEGGILPLPDATLEFLAQQHQALKLPYIIDEIQTGCGRLGEIFAYSDTPLATINPDYVLLSKSLGGGMVKIGATLIRKDCYEQDFGILHTSTFGEDALSARVANQVLALLGADNQSILRDVKQKGERLINSLRGLQQEFPEVIKEVRGNGLMIGVEFTSLDERSPFFRAAGRQGVLSLLIASYLLHYYHIRVLAPISTMLKGNPGKKRLSTIRIQPAALISNEEMDLIITALREVCQIIHANNEFCLLGHLVGTEPTLLERQQCQTFPARYPMNDDYRHIDARVGFVMHPTTIEKLVEYFFPSFESYRWSRDGLRQWWNKISRFLEPMHVKNEFITSNDFVIELALVLVPYLPEYITTTTEPYLQREIKDKIQDAVTIARELGDDNIPVSIVGLGAYTSIATQNGETINYYEVPITTGNAYTVGLSVQSIFYAAHQTGLAMDSATVAVVGAGGNIGSVMASILAPRVGKLVLIGGNQGKQSEFRLTMARKKCAVQIINEWAKLVEQGESAEPAAALGELGQTVMQTLLGQYTSKQALLEAYQADESQVLQALMPMLSGIASGTDLAAIKAADIVVVATSSFDEALIRPEHVKPGAIVCGTSVPSNLSNAFSQQPERYAFDGGFAKLPDASTINFVGMPADGIAYGCLAETLVLGFDGQNHSFSKGMLNAEQVYQIMAIAQTHGFDLGALKFNDAPLSL